MDQTTMMMGGGTDSGNMSMDVQDLRFGQRIETQQRRETHLEKGNNQRLDSDSNDEDDLIGGLGKNKMKLFGQSDVAQEFGDTTVMESGNKRIFLQQFEEDKLAEDEEFDNFNDSQDQCELKHAGNDVVFTDSDEDDEMALRFSKNIMLGNQSVQV